MTRRNFILLLIVSFLIMVYTVQSLSQTRSSTLRKKQSNSEHNSRSGIDREQRLKEFQKRVAKIKKEFLHEKYALGATEEQWKVIKAKLEKVRHLRDQATSTVGVRGGSSSGNRSIPTWQWKKPWKDKAPGELTEAQKLTKELIALVERRNTPPEEFRRKMDDLRESRRRQENLKKQLSEARQELREVLTVRQEAALVLMHWL